MKYVMHVVLVLLLVQGTLAAKEETGKTERTRGGMAFLGKNVRLDFRMVPDEPDDEPLFLITAVSKFRAHASFENDEGEFSFRVGGQIDVTEEGLLLVVYEAEMSMHGMAGGGETHAGSGVLLKPGKELGVARIGDKTLMIKATYIEE